MDALITMRQAGFYRDNRWLVQDIDLDLREGEVVTLIGPNGSGKSTTAKLALGILKPDAGKIVRRHDLKVGYVPQKLSIDWTMPLTVARFLDLTGKVNQTDKISAIHETDISQLLKKNVQSLSGGEFQRVLLARSIARKPNLLVLDEPVQGVDFKGEVELYELISSIRDILSCGILMISHDLHVVMAKTDRVLCLNNHICCSGTPKSVIETKQYRDLFGDRANNILAVYEHNHDHQHLPDGRVLHEDGTITKTCHHNNKNRRKVMKDAR